MALVKRSYNPYQIAGKSVTSALRQPGLAEDLSVPVWNNGVRRWQPGQSNSVSGNSFKTAHFDPDGVADVAFVIADAGFKAVLIVFSGGQELREGEHYNKNEETKTVTYLGAAADLAGVGIDILYFRVPDLSGRFHDAAFEEFFE